MANVCIIGKKGSKSQIAISKNTSIKLYKGEKVDAIVNYGLSGSKLRIALHKYPAAKRVPILNKYVGLSKYTVVQEAHKADILVPKSYRSLPRSVKLSDWIEKRVHSSQGNDICIARRHSAIPSKYYQRMISDRRFELRVHAFSWIPQNEWALYKRHGPADQIAWNFHQGGHFQTVRQPNGYQIFTSAKDIATKILKMCKMAFGAVDLIVDNNMKVYFIEVNASPGFTELSQDTYFNAMEKLCQMHSSQIAKFGR